MTTQSTTPPGTFDARKVKQDFPILQQTIHGKPLTYLDSAASSQKPSVVIEALDAYYRASNANIHRGVYWLSERATALYDEAREKVARFINAPDARSCVFVRNATEALNLVAYSWGRANLGPGDTVVLTLLEHHSNIVPWQIITAERGATIRYVDIDDDGRLRLDQLDHYLRTERVKLVGVTHVANALGTINPVAEIAARAHAAGALVLVDGAQSVPHMPVDVQALDIDFLVFSGHKMLGPMGIGVLWGRREILEAMPPFLGGGDMIREVTTCGSTWADLPAKFEAGTPSVGDAVGLGAAIDYLTALGMDAVRAHEREIVAYALERLAQVPGITLYGPTGEDRAGVVSFTLDDIHPHDIASILDSEGVAIRAGHHCAQPLMDRLGVVATARASFYVYNSEEDVDRLADALQTVRRIFGPGA
ncbi:cysteine desulfurase [Sphaerobacter thermophilus]|uniref:Cysteine desulfurase n=1 Tax=Sphaerobacter thermophilus (strain ATCC 49802 / DSM 20745 / KCCM 41009 / NCIMB 13125 / S 6022) TaxID=479434 RepID=D1C3Z3_SPHTD|nr:cysteine desulfurase [Sphaerobacter thermophilus]ACZ38960.1 cysteine desulfurase, SufS subfamily [Sphaerobacter thermophilus DSM 20745]PZN62648.1 MAG: cysteine desulfurase [Sphaerobacter thermophilus]